MHQAVIGAEDHQQKGGDGWDRPSKRDGFGMGRGTILAMVADQEYPAQTGDWGRWSRGGMTTGECMAECTSIVIQNVP